jgi:Xaa-Pro aminopeptidase
MERRGLSHLIVYGDREHFANLAYLTGFDPRFEEAVLIISGGSLPLLVVGNECEGYLPVSPLFVAGQIRTERYQPFSLLNQPRDSSRLLNEILGDEGITEGSVVGCVGWKYLSDLEHPDSAHAIDLPSYLVDSLRDLAGRDNVLNVTDMLMSPDHGLRAECSPREIAYFEYTSALASEGMKRMVFGLRDGMSDHELAGLARYTGEPLGCHMTIVTKDTLDRALSSPVGATIRRGDPLIANVCYWGSNTCRAGWVASSARDLPLVARDYVERFAGLYFEAMSAWYGRLRIGALGGDLSRLIAERLPYERFGIYLNAGHLIHLDEWLSSPIYPDSQVPIRSGMVLQTDVIPCSSVYVTARMEDGVVIADDHLSRQLADEFPDCHARCLKRRRFVEDVLGIELPTEVLPLSNIPAIVPPLLLAPHRVLAMEQ